jgi:acetyl-CoA carboxylase biotin carboxyl carrier protein
MSQAFVSTLTDRIRRLANFLTESDAVGVSIEREDGIVEIRRRMHAEDPAAAGIFADGLAEPVARRLDAIKADLVGIFRFSRPAPVEGEILESDRELGYVEALGIRNPVHSLGAGRIATITTLDGAAVEYGQPLFFIDRG